MKQELLINKIHIKKITQHNNTFYYNQIHREISPIRRQYTSTHHNVPYTRKSMNFLGYDAFNPILVRFFPSEFSAYRSHGRRTFSTPTSSVYQKTNTKENSGYTFLFIRIFRLFSLRNFASAVIKVGFSDTENYVSLGSDLSILEILVYTIEVYLINFRIDIRIYTYI